jgi:hypothetical protein
LQNVVVKNALYSDTERTFSVSLGDVAQTETIQFVAHRPRNKGKYGHCRYRGHFCTSNFSNVNVSLSTKNSFDAIFYLLVQEGWI